MKKIFLQPIDFSKIDVLVYHLPDGPTFSLEVGNLDDLIDVNIELGDFCDTSDIDGVLHFFPKGNA
ncbi:MAG: hypothetical protein CSA33_00160 [Desulfobulbus propionicus]|nr:MAG: hypothetical protein CSA33_00160 [Desulfobulbus propionicus]